MDGMNCSARFGTRRSRGKMPVIFLTSKDDELDEALGCAMGADDYISKPFSQRLLIAASARFSATGPRAGTVPSGEAAEEAAARSRALVMDPARQQGPLGRQGRHADRHRVPDSGGPAQRPGVVKSRNHCSTSPIRTRLCRDERSTATSSGSRRFRTVDGEFDAIETLLRRLPLRRR